MKSNTLSYDNIKDRHYGPVLFGVDNYVLWSGFPVSRHYILVIDEKFIIRRIICDQNDKYYILKTIIETGDLSDFVLDEYYYINDVEQRHFLLFDENDLNAIIEYIDRGVLSNAELRSLPEWFTNEIILGKLKQ